MLFAKNQNNQIETRVGPYFKITFVMNSKCSYFVQPQLRKKGLKYNALLSRDEREPDVSEAKLRLRPRLEKF